MLGFFKRKVYKPTYVTIVGFSRLHGIRPFVIGRRVRCEKEPQNPVDPCAMKAYLPDYGHVGYIANHYTSAAGGTYTADRIYDKVKSTFYVKVCFTTRTKVICEIEDLS